MAETRGDYDSPLWRDLMQALRRAEGQRDGRQLAYSLIETANVPTGRTRWTQVERAQTIDIVPEILEHGLALYGHCYLLPWDMTTRMPQLPRVRPLFSRQHTNVQA